MIRGLLLNKPLKKKRKELEEKSEEDQKKKNCGHTVHRIKKK